MSWAIYAFIGACCIAVHQLSLAKLVKLGLPISFVNAIIYSLAAICLVGIFLYERKSVTLKTLHIPWIIIAAISVTVVIAVTLIAFDIAPNIGYVSAILSFCTVLVTLFSVLFLGSSLTLIKGIGIGLVVMGIVLLGI